MSRSNEYAKKHYQLIAGFRLREPGKFYNGDHDLVYITPEDFLVSKNRIQPFIVYNVPDYIVHVPRSLCDRATITVRKDTKEIVATSKATRLNRDAEQAKKKQNEFLNKK